MKRRVISGVLAGVLSVGMAATSIPAVNVLADDNMGWREENGVKYWYENDVKQGTEGRGKEIYDRDSDAWYWLDAVDGGKMAVSKDVYQESQADDAGNIGKWVRYDENGHMVKGWDEQNGNRYYFDPVYGTMAKGDAVIDGVSYYFNTETGILERSGAVDDDGNDLSVDGWHNVDGVRYWYEGGVRQGYKTNEDGSIDLSYRGKEIYDPGSDAWYWLDNVLSGAVAKDKDVYQESQADDAGTIGKWVRYDSEGHMVKGWDEKDGNKYYFDPVYGTMAKGIVNVDGTNYEFDQNTGVLLREVTEKISYFWADAGYVEYTADGKVTNKSVYEHTEDGKILKSTSLRGKTYDTEKGVYYAQDENDLWTSYESEYKYDAAGNVTQRLYHSYSQYTADGVMDPYLYYYEVENLENGYIKDDTYTYYNHDGSVSYKTVGLYDNGKQIRYTRYDADGNVGSYTVYEYADGKCVKNVSYDGNDKVSSYTTYTYDENGNQLKTETWNPDGGLRSYTENLYSDGRKTESIYYYYVGNGEALKSSRMTYEYDENGNITVQTSYSVNSDGSERINSRQTYSYENYNGRTGYTKTYDSEYSRWNYEEQEYKLGYSYGYEYIREDGVTVKYINYTYDANYQKVINYYEVYNRDYSLPTATPGDIYTVDHYTTKYDADNNVIGYMNRNYRFYARKLYN